MVELRLSKPVNNLELGSMWVAQLTEHSPCLKLTLLPSQNFGLNCVLQSIMYSFSLIPDCIVQIHHLACSAVALWMSSLSLARAHLCVCMCFKVNVNEKSQVCGFSAIFGFNWQLEFFWSQLQFNA
jgi:hypothetical protein